MSQKRLRRGLYGDQANKLFNRQTPERVYRFVLSWGDGNYWYNGFVPTICSFDGITIRMYYDDHLPAHFHVAFSGEFAKVGIDPITILAGTMPRNIRSKVFEWAAIHQAEL